MKKPKFINSSFNSLQVREFLQINIVISLVFLIVPLTNYAQDTSNIQSNAAFAEKIYLQLDGKVYTTGNTVWFKSIVTNANDHIPTTLSGVLHVELIAPDETVVEKKLIKLENGIGQGFFNLDKTLNEGLYLIRAYTQWNKNFGTDFIFKAYIQVFTAQKTESIPPIDNVTLIKGLNSENYLEANFNPFAIDSLHKKKLTVFITSEGITDTLYVKKDSDKKYRIKYTVPDTCYFVTLQMQTSNKADYAKTIILNNKFIDIQFFPESGELVHGLPNKLGVKALDAYGKGIKISGEIMNKQDSVMASFSTNPLGMGSFILSHADSTNDYFAKIDSQSTDDYIRLYPLPKVARLGNVLSVNRNKNNTVITALSNYMVNDSIFLQISHRGIRYFELKAGLKEGAFSMEIPNEEFPDGITQITMLDKLRQPVAERLYFNEKPDDRIKISLDPDKDVYQKREQTRLKIKTTDSEGKPLNSNVSVLVINQKQLGKMQDTKQNILSYFLLDSELKGEIENPGYYFRKDSSRYQDLDALMLTQGWRKYLYVKPYKEISFQPEQFLTVSGQVSGVLSSKRQKRAKLTLVTLGKDRSVYTQMTDSLGRFEFNLGNEYGQNLNILLQSSKKSGKKMNYTITLDTKESPPVNFNHIKNLGKPDSIVQTFVEKDIQRNKINDAYQISSDQIAIKEVTVRGYKLTSTRKKVMKVYGKPDEVIEGGDILEKKEKWSSGLYSVLQNNYSDKVSMTRFRSGFLFASVLGSDATLVVIDGIPVRLNEYPLIPNIPVSEVSSFEIIKCASNFYPLFIEVYGFIPPKKIKCGGVISIYTYGQKGFYGANKPVGLMQATVPVFSAPREFYAPKYDKLKPDDWNKPDLRALIDWEPELKTDSLGEASVSFYNADTPGKMMVIVEAISVNGKIGYKEIGYNVEERKGSNNFR